MACEQQQIHIARAESGRQIDLCQLRAQWASSKARQKWMWSVQVVNGMRCKFVEVSLSILLYYFFMKTFGNFREQRLSIKSELQIRKKALVDDNFPSQEIIDEFFQTPIEMTDLKLEWNQPNVVKFLVFVNNQDEHSSQKLSRRNIFRK